MVLLHLFGNPNTYLFSENIPLSSSEALQFLTNLGYLRGFVRNFLRGGIITTPNPQLDGPVDYT